MRPCCPHTRVDVRELLPDWLLSPAYAFRRAFLPRHRRFYLTRDGTGAFGPPSGSRLPHGRVLLRPRNWPAWEALELQGVIRNHGSSLRWGTWLERPGEGDLLELDLPYGLDHLAVRLVPDPQDTSVLTLELAELGAMRAARTALAEASPVMVDELRRVLDGTGSGRARMRTLVSTLRDTLDAASYRRWLRIFDVPSTQALDVVRARALASGLRLSLVTRVSADVETLAAELPGRVEVVQNLSEATGDVVLPLPPGTRLLPHAVPLVVFLFGQRPDLVLLYSDDDRLEAGRRANPDFKPVLGPELLRSRNLLRGLLAIRRSEMPPADDVTLDDAGLYGLSLACTAGLAPGRIRRLPVVLATLDPAVGVDADGERAALAAHLQRTGIPADVGQGLAPGLHHVRYRVPGPPPRVTLIMPTRNARELVETSVRSIRRLTRYPNYEIQLVDNGSDAPDALAAFARLARAGDVVLHRDPRPFNFSALNNAAVGRTEAEAVCLINNDIEALDPGWLEEMVSVALQPGVGAVGAKLLYPDGRIQHGGVLVGLHGAADHAYAGAPGNAPGYAQQLLVRREVSAVTAACLVVRRALYLEVGGLDEDAFPVSFNDVDFCLKLRERGYRNVWTPHARLVHHESASRGKRMVAEQKSRADRELAVLRTRWADALVEDPFHSPNLSLFSKVPRLAWPPREQRPWFF
jgi:O-antigen biosynthesis protein